MKSVLLFALILVKYCIGELQCGYSEDEENDIIYLDEHEFPKSQLPNWIFIVPGTKWCGEGNISTNYDDLGYFEKTDRCCRAHDYCQDVIPACDTKYNLTNPNFYSRLSCECDEEFYNCLKDVGSILSTKVGYVYFNILGTQCFRDDYPAVCVKYRSLPIKKCVEYKYEKSQEKLYQWFDVPGY